MGRQREHGGDEKERNRRVSGFMSLQGRVMPLRTSIMISCRRSMVLSKLTAPFRPLIHRKRQVLVPPDT
jgi:hypothetical protein